MVLEVQKAAIYENAFPDRSERDKILTKILKCFPTKEQTSKVSGYIYMEWLWESTSCILLFFFTASIREKYLKYVGNRRSICKTTSAVFFRIGRSNQAI